MQWLAPLQKQDLWKAYLSSHAVLDQFVLPSFGGVTFEALALGCRVLTNVDTAAAQRFFPRRRRSIRCRAKKRSRRHWSALFWIRAMPAGSATRAQIG